MYIRCIPVYIFSYMIFGGRSRRKPHFGWAVPGIDWALCRSVLVRELFRYAGILSLCHDEPPVEAFELGQLLVGAAFHEMTLVEYDQTVRVAQCGQTVCNGERGAVLARDPRRDEGGHGREAHDDGGHRPVERVHAHDGGAA